MGDHLDQIRDAVIGGNHKEIDDLVLGAIEDKVNLNEILNVAMIPAMDVVGKKFSEGEIFVPEMLVSAHTMKRGLELIRPFLKAEEIQSRGTIIMCTVKGDIHDIGKNIVIMMLEGAGFTVSALLTTTMPEMKNVIETLKSHGLRDSLKVMVGGAPVDAAFAEAIGADGYGKDAAEAVKLARAFVEP